MNQRVFLTVGVIVLLFTLAAPAWAIERFGQQDVFVAGEEGYNTFRIPALTVTPQGTLLAFCEGRKAGRGDAGDIDLVLKRSTDRGETWSDLQIVWNDEANTCGNPCPVIDRQTGAITLLMTWNRGDDHEAQIIAQKSKDTRRVFMSRSEDDGKTWSKPADITPAVKDPNWTWYATGPGAGVQLAQGDHAGRLVVPCDHIEAKTKRYYSHIIFSDDGGKTWQRGGRTPRDKANECEVVELSGGAMLLNSRNYDRSKKTRIVSVSGDGGVTWTRMHHDDALIEPICQASIRRASWGKGGDIAANDSLPRDRSRILFANPADEAKRVNMTVRLSYDEGMTWAHSKQIHAGPSAYSCLAVYQNSDIGLLYERGGNSAYEKITLATFNIAWLTNGEDD